MEAAPAAATPVQGVPEPNFVPLDESSLIQKHVPEADIRAADHELSDAATLIEASPWPDSHFGAVATEGVLAPT